MHFNLAAHGWDDTGITLEQTGVPGDSLINVGGRDAAWGPQPGILIPECRQQNLGSRQGRGGCWRHLGMCPGMSPEIPVPGDEVQL